LTFYPPRVILLAPGVFYYENIFYSQEDEMNVEQMRKIHESRIGNKWHRTKRKGNTGVGFTYETLLGIRENNDRNSDLSDAEIKTHRKGSKGATTLFTKNPSFYGMDKREAVKTFGNWDPIKNRWGLWSLKNFDKEVTSEKILIKNDGKIIYSWDMRELESITKIDNLIYVYAETRSLGGTEEFKFDQPILVKNAFKDNIRKLIETGVIYLEPRIWYDGKKYRDRGWAWRIRPSNLNKILEEK
jgi:hypothetical protein